MRLNSKKNSVGAQYVSIQEVVIPVLVGIVIVAAGGAAVDIIDIIKITSFCFMH